MTNTTWNIATQAHTVASRLGMHASGGFAPASAFAVLPMFGRTRIAADVAKRTQGTSVWSPPT